MSLATDLQEEDCACSETGLNQMDISYTCVCFVLRKGSIRKPITNVKGLKLLSEVPNHRIFDRDRSGCVLKRCFKRRRDD
ncbi:hypothetical protein SAMN04487948_1352 [Halogranum amylolyticum]|uniref:Uncharacterized protein n=1 Tax=Halogranum amylolyticum TaxID=660520 RepID=A0A1H8WN88_9EURY|nr:hypothetical protein SAMN04487948_1352 [Halogranum amylolyticum]